ncbi:MAG TPA: hypothetical protein VNK24_07135 [Elusimicrobiota bacterium]|nr:hypothetical protein [Elusimicrobiota bacterium]
MNPENRREYLERLIPGLEQTIENIKFELQYYDPNDLQLRYAKKFLAASEGNLAKARQELESLGPAEPQPPKQRPYE